MKFEFLNSIIDEIKVDLEILKRKTQRNRILLYQHEGILSASDEKIGNLNECEGQFLNAIQIAKDERADLFMTPEYSCPWSVIKRILVHDQILPSAGKLWVLGCESISLNELSLLKNEFESEILHIHFDEELENTNSFVDPICYVFKAEVNGILKTIVLVQFKTFHMGVWQGGDIERDNLILGEKIYILKNNVSSIHLITLVCSEAMNFRSFLTKENKQLLEWEDKPYFILQPQLNPNPYHRDFIDFRACVFEEDHKEVLTLNWQLKSKVGGEDLLPHCNARSGFYIHSDQLNLSKERINSNHNKGLYYFNNRKNRHSYFLSSNTHVFVLENSPLKISEGVNPQQRRDGPEILKVFELNGEQFDQIEEVDDAQLEYYGKMCCTNEFLCDTTNCVVDKERLISISSGIINKDKEWWKVENVDSIQMDSSSEVNKRITVARDESRESLSLRNSYCEAIAELENIITNKTLLPSNIEDISNEDLKIGFTDDSINEGYRFNVLNSDGENVFVSICYIGPATVDQANETYVSLRKLFSKLETRDIERVVVYFKQGTKVKSIFDSTFAKINETHDYDDDSIIK